MSTFRRVGADAPDPPIPQPESAAPVARLETPSHGQGKLLRGSRPGRQRVTEEFRALMRELVIREESVAALTEILNDKDHKLHVQAQQFAAAYGFGRPQSGTIRLDDIRARLEQTFQLLESVVPEEARENMRRRFGEIWKLR